MKTHMSLMNMKAWHLLVGCCVLYLWPVVSDGCGQWLAVGWCVMVAWQKHGILAHSVVAHILHGTDDVELGQVHNYLCKTTINQPFNA